MAKYYRKKLSNKEEYQISLKCSKCRSVWNSLEPEDVNLKLCPDCQNEQKIIDELSNAGLRIRYLETLYDTDRNIMIFKNHKKQNISIHILSNFCYTIFNSNNNHPMTVATVDEIINYLGQPNL